MDTVNKLIDLKSQSSDKKKLFLKAIYQNLLKDNSRLLNKWNLKNGHTFGDTYLSTAAKIGDCSAAKKLLDAGADTELTDLYGYTPIACAIFEHHNEIVKIICKKSTNLQSNIPYGALHLAVAVQNSKAIKILLKEWPSLINQKNSNDKTALHIAIEQGLYDIILELVQKGVDFRECCSEKTSLQLAINRLKSISSNNNKDRKCAEAIIKIIVGYESVINCQTHNSYGFCESDIQLIETDNKLHKYYLNCSTDMEKLQFKKQEYQSNTTKLFLKYKC